MSLVPVKNPPNLEVDSTLRPVDVLNTSFIAGPAPTVAPAVSTATKIAVSPATTLAASVTVAQEDKNQKQTGRFHQAIDALKEGALAAQHTLTTIVTGAPCIALLKEFGSDMRALAFTAVIMVGAGIAGGVDSGLLRFERVKSK